MGRDGRASESSFGCRANQDGGEEFVFQVPVAHDWRLLEVAWATQPADQG